MMFELIIIAIMLAFNAIFAAYEMGLASISRSKIAALIESKKKGSWQAAYMKERMEGSLATMQIGITLVGAIAAATGGVGVEESFAPYLHARIGISEPFSEFIALVLFVIPLSLATIIFAELIPKMLALDNKEWIVLRLSPAMRFLSLSLYPVISVIEKIVKSIVSIGTAIILPGEQSSKTESLYELKAAVSIAKATRLLGKNEEKIVLSAAQLSMRKVRDIMTPASDVSIIWAGSTISEAFIKAHLDMHTRFPISENENDPQSIFGFINFKDILSATKTSSLAPTVKAITRPIKKVDENAPLSELLERMIHEKNHITLVVNNSQVLGMVTLEDILEELVGEIEDEFDLIPSIIQPYGADWMFSGSVSITTVASTVGFDWSGKYTPGVAIPTLTEWCTQKLGRYPKGGDIVESDNLRVLPRKFRRHKLAEALVNVIK